MKRQREKVEQEHGVQLLRSLGAKVYVSGTRRPHGDHQGTCQTPGIPDVEAWLPRDGGAGQRLLLKWEVKAVGGSMSPEQREYAALCLAADVCHVAGDFEALVAWLIAAEYCRAEDFATYRTERPVSHRTEPR